MNEPGMLPKPLSSMVGRRQELAALARLFAGHRLVTLVGPGGAGKTRLAIELGRKLQAGLDNRVVFVDLSTLQITGMVGSQVAAA
ncbi:MAG TPA: LuxR family transcriptional regulator, partial [Actinomycetota bacterium]|nr:LuxR family transcriptional regulator [Actinomycetota bacterium]